MTLNHRSSEKAQDRAVKSAQAAASNWKPVAGGGQDEGNVALGMLMLARMEGHKPRLPVTPNDNTTDATRATKRQIHQLLTERGPMIATDMAEHLPFCTQHIRATLTALRASKHVEVVGKEGCHYIWAAVGSAPSIEDCTSGRPRANKERERKFMNALEATRDKPLTTPEIGAKAGIDSDAARRRLNRLHSAGKVTRSQGSTNGVIYWQVK